MNAVAVINAIGGQVKRPRAQRIGGAAGLPVFPLLKLGLARYHLFRRCPCGPGLTIGDIGNPRPFKPRLADRDAILRGLAGGGDQIQMPLGRVDDDRAHWLGTGEIDILLLIGAGHLFHRNGWHAKAAISACGIMCRIRLRQSRRGCLRRHQRRLRLAHAAGKCQDQQSKMGRRSQKAHQTAYTKSQPPWTAQIILAPNYPSPRKRSKHLIYKTVKITKPCAGAKVLGTVPPPTCAANS